VKEWSSKPVMVINACLTRKANNLHHGDARIDSIAKQGICLRQQQHSSIQKPRVLAQLSAPLQAHVEEQEPMSKMLDHQ
jgi:hypothetical protein